MFLGCGYGAFSVQRLPSVSITIQTLQAVLKPRKGKNNMQSFVINQNRNKPDLWEILSINNPDGSARTDGRYPARVGCTVAILVVGIGKQLVWSYLANADGNEKCGVRESGRLNTVSYDPATEILYVESTYSHYRLKKLQEKWGDIYADRSIGLPDWYPGEFGAIPISVPIEPTT